jgi:hypothetical protein
MYNEEEENTISQYHGPGHFGINKTVNLMQQGGINYPGLRDKVTEFIKACPCCQKMSFITPVINTNPFVTFSTEPIKCLNIDTIGPLPPDEEDNKYIIVIICHTSCGK